MTKEPLVKTHIINGKVKKLEIADLIITAKDDGVPLEELGNLLDSLAVINELLDLNSISSTEIEIKEWTADEIVQFLRERNKRQLAFFEILTEVEEIEREELIEKIGKRAEATYFSGKELGGLLAGITIRIKTLKKEKLYNRIWKSEDDGRKCYYRANSKYVDAIEDFFSE